jgi:hypothetical protein
MFGGKSKGFLQMCEYGGRNEVIGELSEALDRTSLTAAGVSRAAAQQQAAPAPSNFRPTTSAYREASQSPNQYICADSNVASPPLQWSNALKDTARFEVIFHDTDAAPAKVWWTSHTGSFGTCRARVSAARRRAAGLFARWH